MLWMLGLASAQVQLGAGVQDTFAVAGRLDGPRLSARYLSDERVALVAALAVNPLAGRTSDLDNTLMQVVGVSSGGGLDFQQPVIADIAALQIGLDAGPMAINGEDWSLGPRAHVGLEPRLVQTTTLRWEGDEVLQSEPSRALRAGVYGGLSAELWRNRVGLRFAWTLRPVLTESPQYDPNQLEDGDLTVAFDSSRTLELMVSL